MTGWIIFGAVVLFLVWLFTRHITVTGVYDAHPELRVRVLFITLVKVPPDPAAVRRKEEKKRRKAEKERKKAEKQAAREPGKAGDGMNTTLPASDSAAPENKAPAGTDKKPAIAEKHAHGKEKSGPGLDVGMMTDLIKSAAPPIKRLLRKIKFRDVYIDCVVGSDDAAVTALKYGGYCAAIYSLTELIRTYFDSHIREVNIEADFSAEKDDIFAYGTIQLRISTALGCALWLGVRVLKTYTKHNSPKDNGQKKRKRPEGARMKG